jgi:hypothetical protein
VRSGANVEENLNNQRDNLKFLQRIALSQRDGSQLGQYSNKGPVLELFSQGREGVSFDD